MSKREPKARPPEATDVLEHCPVCRSVLCVRLDVRQLPIEDGELPLIGCGAPWHYVNRAVKPPE